MQLDFRMIFEGLAHAVVETNVPTVCCLQAEAQKASGAVLVQTQRPEDHKCRYAWTEGRCPGLSRERQNLPFFCLFIILSPQ
jgi:hypothetical protein